MSDSTYQPKVYRKQGAEELVVANGGTITVESGGTIEVESGGTLTIADGSLETPDLALAQGSIMVGDANGKGSALSVKDDAKILVGNGTTATSVAVSGDATIDNAGALTIAAGAVEAAMLASAVYPVAIPLNQLVTLAAHKDALPDAPDATSLGLADSPGSPLVGTTTNGGTTASASETAGALIALPANYVDGQAITLRIRAKVSAARQVAQTVDAVVKLASDGALGSDICATAAQSLTTDFANYDFTVTPTGLVAGDVLWVEITLATDDTGASADGYPSLAGVSIRPTVRV